MDSIIQAFVDGWAVPDERPIYEWARENIDLPSGGYAIPGPFNPYISRHLLPVFDALQNDAYARVNVVKATQTAGTLTSDIFVPWTVKNRPGPILWSWATDPLARQHAETRAMPVIRKCPALKSLLPDDPRKFRAQEIIFKHGIPLYIQGPSEGNLQGKSIQYLINDECWQWKPGRLREAQARTSAFKKIGRSKELNISQAGEEGDDWHRICEDAIQFDWEVPCQECKAYQSLLMEEEGENGKTIYRMKWDDTGPKDDEFTNVRYACKDCGHEMRDSDALKAFFNEHGRMRCLNPEKQSANVTFHWTSLIWRQWSEVVKEYRAAIIAKRMGVMHPLIAFLQKEMAFFWNPKKQAEVFATAVRTGKYDPKDKWEDERFRFLTVDCQAHFLEFWAVVRAWGPMGSSRRLWRGRLDSFEAVHETQKEWGVRSQFVILDSGYRASEIYRVCCRHVDETGRGWVAMKGSPSEYFVHNFPNKKSERRVYSEKQAGDPLLGLKNSDVEKWLASVSPQALEMYRRGALKCPLYLFSDPSIKEILANLREGKGSDWLAPEAEADTLDEVIYQRQLWGEVIRVVKDAHGADKREFHEVGANHYFDAEKMQTVAAIMGGSIPLPSLN